MWGGGIAVYICDVKCDYEYVGINFLWYEVLKIYVVSNIAFYFV